MYSVYKVTNKVNGKIYIGWTSKSVTERWRVHQQQSFAPKGQRYHFQNAIVKYGPESFHVETLISSYDKSFSLQMEEYYIARFRTHLPTVGYNRTLGGEGNIPNEEQRRERSKRIKGENHPLFGKRGIETHWYGRKHREESLKKMSESKKGTQLGERNPFYGKKHSEESIEKMKDSISRLERSGENNAFYGKKHSEDTKQKMSEAWAERRSKLPINQPETIQLITSLRKEKVTWDKMGARLAEHGIINPRTGKPYSPMGCQGAYKLNINNKGDD